MTRDDDQCLKLGREVARMIHELHATAGGDAGYTRRGFSFPGGEVTMFIVATHGLADAFEAAARQLYNVITDTTLRGPIQ